MGPLWVYSLYTRYGAVKQFADKCESNVEFDACTGSWREMILQITLLLLLHLMIAAAAVSHRAEAKQRRAGGGVFR